jgi:hypothetical protein
LTIDVFLTFDPGSHPQTNFFFSYDPSYSRWNKKIRGGAMGSPFTMTLANIYMYEWEQTLFKYQQERNELYGR